MMSALLLIGVAFAICLAATPLLLVIWLLHRWSKWCSNMVNGSDEDEGKKALKLLGKLLK